MTCDVSANGVPYCSVARCPKCHLERFAEDRTQRYSYVDTFESGGGYWRLNERGFLDMVPLSEGQEGFRIRCPHCGFTWLEVRRELDPRLAEVDPAL